MSSIFQKSITTRKPFA